MAGNLTLLCGIPASGKSSYANKLIGKENTVIITPDDFRLELTGLPYHKPAEKIIWGHVELTTRVLLKKGYNIIIDATNINKSSRGQWVRISQEFEIPIFCFYILTPLDICLERNRNRKFPVPDDVIKNMFETFEPPSSDEGFSMVVDLMKGSNESINSDI